MDKYKSLGLFSVLICVRTFLIICSPEASDAAHMAGAALSLIFQYLCAVPMLILYKDKNFSLKKDMLFGKFGCMLYALFFIILGSESFSMLWEVTKSVHFPIDSSLTGALILAAVCVYTASFGIKAVSRASWILAALTAVSLAVMITGAVPKMDLSNFSPSADTKDIIRYALRDLAQSGELVMLFVLMQFSDKQRSKSTLAFFAGKLILTESISLIEITVLGKVMSISDIPFFTAGAFSQPLSIQRADPLYMLLFTMLCVFTATLQIVLSVMFIKELLPKLKYKTLAAAVLMLGISAVSGSFDTDLLPLTGTMIVILAVLFPAAMLIRRKIYAIQKNNNSSNNSSDTGSPDRLHTGERASQ